MCSCCRKMAGCAIANPPRFSCSLGDRPGLLHGSHVEIE
jgi:hypothetical protein